MYTEDDQFDIKLETKEDIEKAKKRNKLIIIIACIILALVIIGIVIFFVVSSLLNKTDATLPVTHLSITEWTKDPITLTVDNQKVKLVSYSFDGGKTWQNENAILIDKNGTYTVVVKNEKGKISPKASVSINNIDTLGPNIQFTDPLYVQKGGVYNYKTSISVTDDGSGVKEYSADVTNIDTTNDGEYTVNYTAVDYVGNITQKSRKVIVKNLATTTYYRYRKFRTESYRCKKDGCTEENSSCYTTCKRKVYDEWSEWSKEKVTPSNRIEVETKIE